MRNFLTMLFSGCCLPGSETLIEEAPAAWQAAFHESVPAEIALQHGRYWQSGHWSGEHAWFFALTADTTFSDSFIAQKRLTEQPPIDIERLLSLEIIFPAPDWFAPAGSTYRLWRRDHLFMLLAEDGRTIYLHSGAL